jgi:hypothetical protein
MVVCRYLRETCRCGPDMRVSMRHFWGSAVGVEQIERAGVVWGDMGEAYGAHVGTVVGVHFGNIDVVSGNDGNAVADSRWLDVPGRETEDARLPRLPGPQVHRL